jgi:hypothetical protein
MKREEQKLLAEYWEWLDAILTDDELQDIANETAYDIRLIAIDIARHGSYGHGCFAADETIAKDFGCKYKTIQRKRVELIRMGWFKVISRNGGNTKRSVVVNIAIPTRGNHAS